MIEEQNASNILGQRHPQRRAIGIDLQILRSGGLAWIVQIPSDCKFESWTSYVSTQQLQPPALYWNVA